MINLDSHRIVDMIPSREHDDVKTWLQTYPNITVVSRDGSVTYHNAIDEALPEAAQVSDRFHLIKNLTSYAREYLKKELGAKVTIPVAQTAPSAMPAEVSIPGEVAENQGIDRDTTHELDIRTKTTPSAILAETNRVAENHDIANENPYMIPKANENRKLTLKEKYERIADLANLGYTKTAICKSLNMDVRTYAKLAATSLEGLKGMFKTNGEERLKQKINRVNEVRKLKSLSIREISRRTGLNWRTVRKYLDEKFTPVHAAYGEKKRGILTPFITEIDSMLSQGIMGTVIEAKIRQEGYTGSLSNLRHYIADWKRRIKQDLPDDSSEVVERKNLFSLLYHPLEKVKSITKAGLDAVLAQYPCLSKVYALVWGFKSLLDSKDPDGLEPWLESASSLDIREIDSFVEGITRDLAAVKNAIALPYSNGLAEGSVNKLKVIKRVMYGRCKFETLRNKTLRLEELR